MRTSGKKLVRRSTPKLRSGCLTCKERRIKCDETKPICLRCSRSNRSCQGYSDPFQYHPTVDVSTLATWSLPFHGSFADTILCSAKEPLTEDEISQDKQSFHHFVTEASIRIPSVLDLGVWTEIIPMLGTSFPAIRYALLALSAQHEMTIRSSYDTNNNKASVHALRLYSYRQYDKAIQRLNMILVDAAQKYDILLETSFACLLLVVYEILRGSDVAAQYHLDGAINLISIPSVAKSQLLLAEYRCASFPIGSGLLKGLGLIFQQLDIQAAAFSGSRPPIGPENVDSITNSLTPSFSNNNINGCSTIEELRQNLLSIQVKISRFISSETALNRKYVPDLKRSKDQKDEYNSIKKEQETLVRRLEHWKSIFDTVSLESNDMMLDTVTIRNSLPKVWPNFHKQRAQIVMLLSYLTYYILLSTSLSPDETAYDSHTSIFAHITDLSEMILQLEPGSFSSNNGAETFSHSSFCIDMKLIYPLYITALKCRDFIIRHRAVRLLSMCDREGVWDGRMMASMAQTVISCEEELAITTGLEYGQGVFPTADYFVDDCIISIPERARIHGVGIVEMDRQKRQLRIICSRKDETTTVDNDVIWRTTLLDVNF